MPKRNPKPENIGGLNVWATCHILAARWNDKIDRPTYHKVATCAYTPKAIGDALKQEGMTGTWQFVSVGGHKELWKVAPKDRLAIQDKTFGS